MSPRQLRILLLQKKILLGSSIGQKSWKQVRSSDLKNPTLVLRENQKNAVSSDVESSICACVQLLLRVRKEMRDPTFRGGVSRWQLYVSPTADIHVCVCFNLR